MADLIQLIYASSAVKPFSSDELLDLLEFSQQNNLKNDITGILLYKDGTFLQVLEGPEDKVNEIWKRIQQDDRHQGLIVIQKESISEREFNEWLMGFADLNDEGLSGLPGYSDFMNVGGTNFDWHESPSVALSLLRWFRTHLE